MSLFSPEELIFYKNEGNDGNDGTKFMSCGFSIVSLLLDKERPILFSSSVSDDNNYAAGYARERNVGSLFKNLAIPAGLFYYPSIEKKRKLFNYNEDNETNYLNDYELGYEGESGTNKKGKKNEKNEKNYKNDKNKTNKNSEIEFTKPVLSEDIHSLLMKMIELDNSSSKKNKERKTRRHKIKKDGSRKK